MDIFLMILPRLLFLICNQFIWNIFIHRDSKKLNEELNRIKKENSILIKECVKIHNISENCNVAFCPVKDCKYNLFNIYNKDYFNKKG